MLPHSENRPSLPRLPLLRNHLKVFLFLEALPDAPGWIGSRGSCVSPILALSCHSLDCGSADDRYQGCLCHPLYGHNTTYQGAGHKAGAQERFVKCPGNVADRNKEGRSETVLGSTKYEPVVPYPHKFSPGYPRPLLTGWNLTTKSSYTVCRNHKTRMDFAGGGGGERVIQGIWEQAGGSKRGVALTQAWERCLWGIKAGTVDFRGT